MRIPRLLLLSTCFFLAAPEGFAASEPAGAEPVASAEDAELAAWLEALRTEALERGIGAETLNAALANVAPRPVVLRRDRSQPRAPGDFCGYLAKRLTPTRIARGQRALEENEELMRAVTAEYGVPARYLVALWGLESNFGDYQGDHPIFDALVTLARDPRRATFFRKQIFAALEIIEAGHPHEEMRGSWAGAMGQVQFMPTTYQRYAVDFDGDGRKDIWQSLPDAMASAANYLRAEGWRSGETWGRQVKLPAGADAKALRGRRSLAAWRDLGVQQSNGQSLPEGNLFARLVHPRRAPEPSFLVYSNYERFMDWNRSTFFAISVGTLADKLAKRSTLRACHGKLPRTSS